jgi:hypothetical protein
MPRHRHLFVNGVIGYEVFTHDASLLYAEVMTCSLQPRTTMYKGIRMRSRLEARVAAFLDREHITWLYEPMAFADERGQYLPDFRIEGMTTVPLYVDVKGLTPTNNELEATFVRMRIIWSSEPRVFLAVWAAEAFGREGRFDVLFPDGSRHIGRITRCSRCGSVSFRAFCHACRQMTQAISPLAA